MKTIILFIKTLITIPLWLLSFPILYFFLLDVIALLSGDYDPLNFLVSAVVLLIIIHLMIIFIWTLWDWNHRMMLNLPFFDPNIRNWFKKKQYDLLEKYELEEFA